MRARTRKPRAPNRDGRAPVLLSHRPPPMAPVGSGGIHRMDAHPFDAAIRARSTNATRCGVFGLAAFLAALAPAVRATAKPARKPRRNAFGCVDVGTPCRGKDRSCCSGICSGPKPKKGRQGPQPLRRPPRGRLHAVAQLVLHRERSQLLPAGGPDGGLRRHHRKGGILREQRRAGSGGQLPRVPHRSAMRRIRVPPGVGLRHPHRSGVCRAVRLQRRERQHRDGLRATRGLSRPRRNRASGTDGASR